MTSWSFFQNPVWVTLFGFILQCLIIIVIKLLSVVESSFKPKFLLWSWRALANFLKMLCYAYIHSPLTKVLCLIAAWCTSIGKTCSTKILQWINNPKEWHNNHWGGAEVIILSFTTVVYPLKNPSNACLIYNNLDNGSFCQVYV